MNKIILNLDDLKTYNWVLYRGKPIRIEEISRPRQKLSLCNNHLAVVVDLKEIEPMPLSKKFLEHNEFKLENSILKDDHSIKVLSYHNPDEDLVIEIEERSCTDETKYFNVVIWKGVHTTNICINYVHELQNLFSVHKINKQFFA